VAPAVQQLGLNFLENNVLIQGDTNVGVVTPAVFVNTSEDEEVEAGIPSGYVGLLVTHLGNEPLLFIEGNNIGAGLQTVGRFFGGRGRGGRFPGKRQGVGGGWNLRNVRELLGTRLLLISALMINFYSFLKIKIAGY
jgi:hypothetical protein